jgi:AcrR family transcriptional regulator
MAKSPGQTPGQSPGAARQATSNQATSNPATSNPATSNPERASVDTESRAKRFMKSALAILGETGRTDFTVLEVVERSKTSLRSFYQHFSTKDELLLALIEKIMSESTKQWREATTGLPSSKALRVLIDRICTPAESSTQDRVNRGLTDYNDHLAETLPREYARVLSPLHELIKAIINRGIAERTFRSDLDVDATAALIMQSALGAMRLRVLGAELNGVPIDADHIYDFCVSGLIQRDHPI